MIVLIIVIVVVVLLVLGLWATYNGLVKKRNRTQEAWSEIDVELKRRHDLIPNLVSMGRSAKSPQSITLRRCVPPHRTVRERLLVKCRGPSRTAHHAALDRQSLPSSNLCGKRHDCTRGQVDTYWENAQAQNEGIGPVLAEPRDPRHD